MTLILICLACCSSLLAQSSPTAEADSLFRVGDYERVELHVLRAANYPDIPDSQRVSLELLGGYSLIMLDREADARTHFRRALEVDSTLTLDPVQVSPKFRVVFDDVKREWQVSRVRQLPTTSVREITQWHGASTQSHVLNLLLPGSGFISERKHFRGAVHLVAQVALATLWLSELSQNNDARKKYLAADSSSQAAALYKTYDDHHRRMWTFGFAAAGVYLASQIDLSLWRTSRTTLELQPTTSALELRYKF